MILALQAPSMNPADYSGASWGVLGALVFVIVVLGAIVYSVFVKGAAATAARDKLLMDFVTGHTAKTSEALGGLGRAITEGDERVAQALEGQARMLQAVLLTWEALQRARLQKAGGAALSTNDIEQIIRASHDAVRRGAG